VWRLGEGVYPFSPVAEGSKRDDMCVLWVWLKKWLRGDEAVGGARGLGGNVAGWGVLGWVRVWGHCPAAA